MSKIEIKKTELVWRGKYDDEGKLIPVEKPGPFPFQIVESINEPRIEKGDTVEKQTSLYDYWKGDEGNTFEDGWKNKLIWGDNKFVMSSLLEKFAGKIDLIYIDPPFATGADFKLDIQVGDKGEEVHKEHSVIEEKAYRDTWGSGLDSFLQMIYERLVVMKELLSNKGVLFVHLDYRTNSHIRIMLDELFGSNNLINEISWKRQTAHSDYKQGAKHFGRIHDTLLFYCNDFEKLSINTVFTSYSKEYMDSNFKNIDENGERYSLGDITGPGGASKGNPHYEFLGIKRYWAFSKETMNRMYEDGEIVQTKPGTVPRRKRYLKDMPGISIQSFWDDIVSVQSQSFEKLDYPTQKPEKLLERVILSCSNESDLVADFFCGSGTTCAVAEKLNRRWIGVDLGRYPIHTTRKRLLEIEQSKSLTDEGKKYGKKAKPFEILNLGRYERQFWKVKAFGIKDEKQSLYQYLAFILKLYGAEPIAGSAQIHGKKGNALVYIGAVDSPVTIQEVTDALKDSKDMGMKELHVLGWEWEMGLNDAIQEVAKQMGIRLKLRIIPMDAIDPQAAGKSDVKFFELAYFKTEIETKGLKAKVKLEDFVIPHTDLITPDVKASIKKWSDWVDYWAVDFNFQNDTFNNGWTSYRTKQERKLTLTASNEYTNAGSYKVFVKIIDIFGIDTSQVYEIKVK